MALRREEDTARDDRVLDLVFDAVIAYGLDGGRITAWNQGAERIYGWSAAEAIGSRPADLIEATAGPPPELLKRHPYFEDELVHRHREGHPVIVAARWALERDGTGTPVGVIAIHRDISEQRKQERERAEFLNLTAHELRSPVTVIAGYLSMIEDGSLPSPDDPDDPSAPAILAVLRAKVTELSDLVEQMVDRAKPQPPRRPAPPAGLSS